MPTEITCQHTSEPIVRYNVRQARTESGLKQYEFAKMIGITPTYLSDLERHVYTPSPELFAKICIFTGKLPSDYVYLDTPPKK